MWCIAEITPEYLERMENILTLYEKPYDPGRPMVCLDEKSKQLLRNKRKGRGAKPGKRRREDYEYKRNGTRNIFMMVEPKVGWRRAKVTRKRKKPDFAECIRELADEKYAKAQKIDVVLDNLNTHFPKSLLESFGKKEAERLLNRIIFHYTPKHASWLNMAEIEIGVMDRQCLNRRIPEESRLIRELAAWEKGRNRAKKTIRWLFTVEKARKKFARFYKSKSSG